MNTAIPDFNESELKLASVTLFERYGKLVPFQLADSELQLDASSEDLTLCPTIYWEERGILGRTRRAFRGVQSRR